MTPGDVRRRGRYRVDGADHVGGIGLVGGLVGAHRRIRLDHLVQRVRLHSANDYLPPIEWEQQHATIGQLPSTVAA
jgi:transposase InsO family protein